MDTFDTMERHGAARLIFHTDPASGLRAITALHDVSVGPACGGIRTQPYPTLDAAIADVQALASAMTLKCALTGLAAGGGKTVVIDHAGLNREMAFIKLGQFINDLGGLYRTAGDLGTRPEDLAHVAQRTAYVDTTGPRLGEKTGDTVVGGIEACCAVAGNRPLDDVKVAIQGCGLIGEGVARRLHARGAALILADVDGAKATALAGELGAETCSADEVLLAEADIIAPCAIGGVITADVAQAMRAWAVCGGANNQLADASIGEVLAERNILFVPDPLASSGAVIDGVCRSVMDTSSDPYIAQVRATAEEILTQAQARGLSTIQVARERAAAARAA